MRKKAARTTIPKPTTPKTAPTMVPVCERLADTGAGSAEVADGVGLVGVCGMGDVCDEGLGEPVLEGAGLLDDDDARQESSGPAATSNGFDWTMKFASSRDALKRYVPGGTSTPHRNASDNGVYVVLSVLLMGPGNTVELDGATPMLDTINVIDDALPKNCH